MKLKFALLAAAGTLALAPASMAQDGWYAGLGAGYTFADDENDFESPDALPAAFATDYDLDEALNIYGSFGRYLSNGYRIELELASRSQDVDELPGDGLGFAGFASSGDLGDVTVTTGMFNVYKDFALGNFVQPYVGLGLGVAHFNVDLNNVSVSTPAVLSTDLHRVVVGDKDWALAGQAMAGLVFDLAENLDVDVRYRYLQTDELRYAGFINSPTTSNVLASLDGEYGASELTAGFRWSFGTPAAAPAPIAAAVPTPVEYKDCWDGSRVTVMTECPAQITEDVVAPTDLSLTVYFDYDKSNLTGAAQSLIQAKTAEALEYDVSSVVVAGNTDSSGSASYNNALSARRASVVRDALTANGINGSLITTQALGESNPAKATGDGVREPLNRRTEVDFNF